MNIVILGGHLGADPEIRFSSGPDPKAMVILNLATKKRYKDKDQQWKEKTEWHRVVDKVDGRAKMLKEHLAKGSRFEFRGELTHRKYEENGQTKYITEVEVQEILDMQYKSNTKPQGDTTHAGSDIPPQGGANDEGDSYGPGAFAQG